MRDEWNSMEQDASRRTGNAILVGAVAFAAFFAFMHFHGQDGSSSGPSVTAVVESGTANPEVVESVPTIIRPPPRESSVSGARESYVGVYECTVNGQRVVSDRPCGDDAEARTLVIDQPGAGDAMAAQQRSVPSPPVPSQRYSSQNAGTYGSVDAPSANDTRCQTIDDEIDRINARMRHPYTTYEGNYLRGHWHALKNERYELGCGR